MMAAGWNGASPEAHRGFYDPRFEDGPDSGMRLQESVRQPANKKPKKSG
jgi:hypothetical protein